MNTRLDAAEWSNHGGGYDLLIAVDAQPKLVVEGHDVGAAIGELSRGMQQCRQTAARERQAISGAGKDRVHARIQSLRQAIADRTLGHPGEPGRSPRIYELQRSLEDVDPRWLITQREVAMRQQVGDGFINRASMIIGTRCDRAVLHR